MLKALIVEDEYPARQELRFLLEPYQNVLEVIGEAQTAKEALSLIEALDYDVVFLDIQMPGMSGMELARILKDKRPQLSVVFISAHEQYAVDAFAVQVVDYLLKPVSSERIAETIRRLTDLDTATPKTTSDVLTWVPCESGGHTIPVNTNDIIFIMAEHEIIYIYTYHDRYPTRFTLQELQERLPSETFLRTHRSFIANMHQVKEIMPYFNGTYLLKMKDKQSSEVVVSRSNVKKVKELFNIT
ncbi:LytTR family DNA-binding domain-containing protein [Sulfobacillus sp. hq2]|uniref:Stage 0 sporulation protein A homolog n=1 Tax=Sulfobacillus thermotolerans TaxID=338644 RepID=A0ABM6RPW8_9FIRM|nr:LytTR family DNA-binding domain-containing protein [Sulfobacillus sp. hq2]AUW93391.1 DNA-binding response regulator [Sulfobacillus thermotolerans]MCY0906975.1 LytTR family DNA-binding domain-containing protein [Sulfobacillus thermotolerans]POB10622.1 DNA-binding response regulator [Sulfobacillus sp. hq2]